MSQLGSGGENTTHMPPPDAPCVRFTPRVHGYRARPPCPARSCPRPPSPPYPPPACARSPRRCSAGGRGSTAASRARRRRSQPGCSLQSCATCARCCLLPRGVAGWGRLQAGRRARALRRHLRGLRRSFWWRLRRCLTGRKPSEMRTGAPRARAPPHSLRCSGRTRIARRGTPGAPRGPSRGSFLGRRPRRGPPPHPQPRRCRCLGWS